MVARACGHSSEELIALGFTKREVAKWQRIASRYRRRQKPEPDPGPWLERYRKKIAEGWTWKSKRPADVEPYVWVRYQNYSSYCRTKGRKPKSVYSYIKQREAEKRRALLPKAELKSTERYKRLTQTERIKKVECKADIKAIAERCREIVAAKLREQGLSLPPKKLAPKR